MAEVVGLVASIISVSKVVTGGVAMIGELYKAPEEVRTLKEQIQVFQCVLQVVEGLTGQPTDALVTTLRRAQKTVEDLHQLVIVKLIRQGSWSGRARRRAWLRNKSKIATLRDNLRDARETLWVALSASSLAATNRMQLSVVATEQQAIATQTTLNELSKLCGTREGTEGAKQLYKSIELTQYDQESGSQSSGDGKISASAIGSTWSPWAEERKMEKSAGCCGDSVEQSIQATSASPASLFELSSSFFPESYTTIESTSRLVGYMNYQEHATEYSRVNRYEMFYCKAPRQWIRVSISATFSVESMYWMTMRMASSKSLVTYDLPAGLSKKLEQVLAACADVEQGVHLSVYLGNRACPVENQEKSGMLVHLGKPQVAITEQLKLITSIAYHWNCPRYSEKEVVQLPMFRLVRDNRFVAYLQSRWVIAFRFGSDKAQIDSDMYLLKVLHCLQGTPGINAFVGTLLDSGGLISGFMMELPLQGNLATLLSKAIKSGRPVSWQRRERWCKQIIKGIAAVHSQDFRIGVLAEALSTAIYIDDQDTAVLCNFQKEFPYQNTRSAVTPPECRHLALTNGSMAATAQTDIYQLGLLIWMIFTNLIFSGRTRFCGIAGCANEAEDECFQPHAYPTQSPSLGDYCPSYIKDIISCCRTEDPNRRLPAWKLLEMFPAAEEIPAITIPAGDDATRSSQAEDRSCTVMQDSGRNDGHVEGSSTGEFFGHAGKPSMLTEGDELDVRCDVCRKLTRDHFFHCNICDSGDYDLCPECFTRGAHCLQSGHYMREMFYGIVQEEMFYTSVDDSGHRDRIKL
ncbi:hypothetical protein GGR52DRAFT_585411 [Hypoxylon sp. FL1284]|nr:hypothetical protein GGR52DRAFT_585411 [Hypoxylon sp. FL1284]